MGKCGFKAEKYGWLLTHYIKTHPSIINAFWQVCHYGKTTILEDLDLTKPLALEDKMVAFELMGGYMEREILREILQMEFNKIFKQLHPCYKFAGLIRRCNPCLSYISDPTRACVYENVRYLILEKTGLKWDRSLDDLKPFRLKCIINNTAAPNVIKIN